MRVGDRQGANLNWLSQYPKEEEVLMPPLSNLEVIGAPRIESSRTPHPMPWLMRMRMRMLASCDMA